MTALDRRQARGEARQCHSARRPVAVLGADRVRCRHRPQWCGQIDPAEGAGGHRDAPTSGRILLGDRDLASLSHAARAHALGFVPQHFDPHWDLNVGELVRLGAERGERVPQKAVDRTIAAFELTGLGHRRWSTLSGGERARVLLATVLVVDPPVLLADEPAASLDIRHRLDVIRALAARGRDRLSIVVVHDLDLAFSFFDRIVLVDRGTVVADAPAQALLDDPRLDAVFGVRFERLQTDDGWLLRARL